MSKHKNNSGWGSAIGSGAITFLTLVLLSLAAILVVVPKLMGGMTLTVLTGSMEPGIKPGDVVVTRGIDIASASELSIGDIIVFLPYPDDPMLVTHRIIGQSVSQEGTSFVTQGDNNDSVDLWGPVAYHQIRGEVLYTIPKIGFLKQWLGQHAEWLIPALAVTILGYSVLTFLLTFRKDRKPGRALEEGISEDTPSTTDLGTHCELMGAAQRTISTR